MVIPIVIILEIMKKLSQLLPVDALLSDKYVTIH